MAVLMNFLAATAAFAGGTEKEAQAMLDRGIAYIKAHGSEEAFKAFSDLNNKDFHDRDLYLYAYDFKGVNIAHGINNKMIGKNFFELKDTNGKPLIKEMIDIGKAKGSGAIEYMWTNPETKKLQVKLGFVAKIPGMDAFLGTGVYK
jgi:cytochrome c